MQVGTPAQVARSCFPFDRVSCFIVVGNETDQSTAQAFDISVCGYQEANAYFEMIKPQVEMDLKQHPETHNWKIKRLSCV